MEIFSKLNKSEISYCVARGQTLSKTSRDVDMVVSCDHFSKLKKVLLKAGFRQTYAGPIPGHQVFTLYANGEFLTLDVNVGGLTHNGILYFPEKYFLPKMSKEAHALSLTLHSIIDKKYFKKEYRNSIQVFSKDLCVDLLGDSLGTEVYLHAQKRNFKKLLQMRNKILLKSIASYPMGAISFFKIYATRAKKLIDPTWSTSLIVCIGPDGSGKTSATSKSAARLSSATIRAKTVYMGWRGSILPFIDKAMKADNSVFKKNKKSKEVENGSRASLQIRSIVISTLYLVELWLRYIFKILPARKTGVVVFCDRYFYDRLALDKHLPSFVKKILWHLFPKPSIVFLFKASAKTLSMREKNLPLKNLESQMSRYIELNKKLKAKVINTDTTSKKEALDIISKTLWKKRLIA